MATFADLFLGSSAASPWESKVWTLLAESVAAQADRSNMSYGAGEPFVDATDLTLTKAAISDGYCANTKAAGASIVPAMSAASQNGYVATASSTYSSYYPFLAFNGDAASIWVASGASTSWLQIQLPSATTITAYKLFTSASPWVYPTAWTLSGSNDGTNFTTLDTRSSALGYSNGGVTFALSSAVTYQYFRLTITGVSVSDGNRNLAEFQLIGVESPNPATITLNPVTISGATEGKIIFTGYNADASAILDVGKTGSNLMEVYPVIDGTPGSALGFTSESLGSNKWRFTSEEFSLSGAASFGVKFQSYARSTAPNFRLYEALFVWRKEKGLRPRPPWQPDLPPPLRAGKRARILVAPDANGKPAPLLQ